MKNLKSKYEQFSIEPSEKSWERLEQKLDKKPIAIFPILWKSVAVILLVLGLSVLWKQEEKEQGQVLAQQSYPKTETQKETPSLLNKGEEIVSQQQIIEKQNPILEKKPLILAERKERNGANHQEKIGTETNEKEPEPIEKLNIVQIEKMAELPQIPHNEKYITAEELLFGVEVQRIKSEQEKSKKRLGKINLPEVDVEPSRMEVLGIKIYEKSEE